jgi:hypothetical protein
MKIEEIRNLQPMNVIAPSATYDLKLMRATPTPNSLLDVALTLPETEARLLLLVTRDTIGYAAGPGLRRASVRLSHKQIGRRIGRSSTAISQAIEGLVSRGLLEVTDEAGAVLATGRERRAQRSALRFRLPRHRVEEAVENRVESAGVAR